MGDYKKLLEERRNWYKKIGKVPCPILKEDVIFNSKGFHHLMYPNGVARPIKEQMYKLGLLPLSIPVIKNAIKIHKYEKKFVKSLSRNVEFWELRESVGVMGALITVTLRKIGTGNITFFSIKKRKERKFGFKIKKSPSGRRWIF